ncbi:MAG: hypothetical protein J5746_00435 [Victivallales bacterium]|nr:hypothetical protein [Victivallales bacterium]
MRRLFTYIFLLAAVLCCSGCGTILYCCAQGHSVEMRTQSNELPAGNILRIDKCAWDDTRSREDYVLPPWLDRSLNSICILCDIPISFAFDVVTFPWQLYSYETLNNEKDVK